MTLELRGVTKEVAGQIWIRPTNLSLIPGSTFMLPGASDRSVG